MYNERIENLVKAALADGVLTEKEKQILFKNAQEQGIDLDEFEMVLEARLVDLEKAKKDAAPKSNKYGDVRKCPACGALVPAFKGICQECGFEFTNVDANLSSKQLAEKLLKENADNKKIEIIETFPIPTTKADLLEFLTSLKPRVLGEYNQFTDAYYKKYQECIEKAKTAFDGDKQLKPFVDGFTELKTQIDSLKKKKSRQNAIAWFWKYKVVVIALVIVSIIGLSSLSSKIKSSNKERERLSLIENFHVSLEQGDLSNSQIYLKDFYENYTDENSYDSERICAELAAELVKRYLANDELRKAEYICENLTYYRLDCKQHIYNWAINKEQYEKALEYSNIRNSIYDASHYYKFVSDVVFKLCQENKKNEAKKFVNKYSIWFKKNVDNSTETTLFGEKENKKEKYKDYYYSVAKSKLLKIINEY